jgi:cytochrome c553
MWGNGTTGVGQTAVTLECGACHDPHGNGNYRILKPSPDGQQYVITAATATSPAVMSTATAVNIPDQTAKVYTTTDYWNVAAPTTPLTTAEVAVNTTAYNAAVAAGKLSTYTPPVTDGFLGGISAWCTTCHTRYLSAGASVVTGDATFTYKHRSDEQANYKPDCIQCHVAHGTNAVMTGTAASVKAPDGLTVTGDPATTGYQNSSLLRVDDRGTCLMCHAVGGPNPANTPTPTPTP